MSDNDSSAAPQIEEILFSDAAFQAIVHEVARRVVTWDEFLEMEMPVGASPVRTWTLVSALAKSSGIRLPVSDEQGTAYWYSRTYELGDAVAEIAAACRTGSMIHRAITASGGQHFMMRMRLDESASSAQLDGLDVDEETLAHLGRGKAPAGAVEQLLLNAGDLANELSALEDRPFSLELFREFRDRLMCGLDERELPRMQPKRGLITYLAGAQASDAYVDERLAQIASYANHETGDDYDHPVLRGQLLSFLLRAYQPLGAVSSMVGRLASQLYFLKHDLPVLALLPVSRLKIEWEDGIIAPPLVACDRPMYEAHRLRKRDDLTILQTITAQLIRLAIVDVEAYIKGWERRDARMRALLRRDPELNQRQRSVIARALRAPESEFTIRYHERNHAIAYATARRDFLGLAEKGYLLMHQRGKTFVFTPSPQLESLIETA